MTQMEERYQLQMEALLTELRSLREAPSPLAVDPKPPAPTTSPTIPPISSLARTEKIEGPKPFSGNPAK